LNEDIKVILGGGGANLFPGHCTEKFFIQILFVHTKIFIIQKEQYKQQKKQEESQIKTNQSINHHRESHQAQGFPPQRSPDQTALGETS